MVQCHELDEGDTDHHGQVSALSFDLVGRFGRFWRQMASSEPIKSLRTTYFSTHVESNLPKLK